MYFLIFLVTFIWGLNGIIDKKALATGHPIEVNFITTFTMIGMAFVYFIAAKYWGIPLQFKFKMNTVFFAMTNGILIPTAYILFLFSISKGSLSTVVTITATYPIVTFLLSIGLLNEPVSFNKIFGIVLVVAGLFIFAK